ncbi:MAG TPA: hypothetical protein VHT70_01175 [Candidatus Saccharimonadales bacterium]|jgi:hypothetical protein|nr:hypothetical protein [Candidatus Saccharimonadales bacterium]
MTRFLSDALGAEEPGFGLAIQELERASGHSNTDIRLSTEVVQRTREKVRQLGLDPHDTTGPELYRALQVRLEQDEANLREALGVTAEAAPDDVLGHLQQFAQKHEAPKSCFALKASVAKRMLKKMPPKKAMKQLGYRSVDSMLKHEPVSHIYAAAFISEPAHWQRHYYEQYKQLRPNDFEMREIAVVYPRSKRWEALTAQFVDTMKHNVLCHKELGTIVLLPHEHAVPGLAITTFLLVMNLMNEIRAYSSFAKLQQVKPHFGDIVRDATLSDPYTSAKLAGQPVPWRIIQKYYGRFQHAYHPDVFEPHVQPEDLQWYHPEDILANIKPTLAFWQDTQPLALLHEGQPVSLNALDVALGYCNQLSFADRVIHFVRENLWHELMLRYLNQENLESAVQWQLSQELVDESPELSLAE